MLSLVDPDIAPTLELLAPAKLNLALHIVGRREDGYHLIETFAVFTRFGDRLRIALSKSDTLTITGPYAGNLAADDGNLVIRARDALRRKFPDKTIQAVDITLEKNLPIASGIGGGSSDAAAALRGLANLWGLDIAEAELNETGGLLGADVPMCLAGRPLVAHGTGELLAPVADVPALGIVMVNPGMPVSTAEVFQKLGKRDNDGLPPLPQNFDFHGLRNWLEVARNDLEPTARAIQPAIGRAVSELMREKAGFARMSGSGATCFGLFETGNVAKKAASAIRKRHPDWFVAATRTIPSEERQHVH